MLQAQKGPPSPSQDLEAAATEHSIFVRPQTRIARRSHIADLLITCGVSSLDPPLTEGTESVEAAASRIVGGDREGPVRYGPVLEVIGTDLHDLVPSDRDRPRPSFADNCQRVLIQISTRSSHGIFGSGANRRALQPSRSGT